MEFGGKSVTLGSRYAQPRDALIDDLPLGEATIDVIVDNLDPSRGFNYKMDFIDTDHAEILRDNTLRPRRPDLEEALRLYGRS